MRSASLKSTGPTSPATEMFNTFLDQNGGGGFAKRGRWMSSAAGSLAKTSATPETSLESEGEGPVCGESTSESFAFFDRDSSLWKMSQPCLFGEWTEYLEIWPRAGMTQNGIASRRRASAPRTSAIACSFWPGTGGVKILPTLTVKGNDNRRGCSPTSGDGLATIARRLDGSSGGLNPEWCEWLMGFPVAWTELEDSETPSSPRSPNSSDDES